MKSAGNDIVALIAVDNQRSISPNFYSKFIVPAEQDLYEQSSAMKTVSFCAFVWLLWSVKESAYKYFKRGQPNLIFPPSKIVVQNIQVSGDGFVYGTLSFQNEMLHYRSLLTNEYIHTIVSDEKSFADVYHDVIKIANTDSQSQSASVREMAMQKLNDILLVDDLMIIKTDAGYPVIMHNNHQLDIPISFAHHDLFVGYSFKL